MTEPFRYPNEFIDWVKRTYPEQFESLIRGGAEADRRLAELYSSWQERGARPPTEVPLKRGAPESIEEYEQSLTAWINIALRLGTYDRATALGIAARALDVVETKGLTQAPFYKEMAAGQDPAAFFQRREGYLPDPERERREREEYLRRTGEIGKFGIPQWRLEQWDERIRAGDLSEEQVTSFIEQRGELQERATERRKLREAWWREPPRPEYMPAFEEERMGLEGPQPWRQWFESRYPTLTKRFQAILPKLERGFWPGLYPGEVEEKAEKTWAEYLKRKTPELREEYATKYPYGMGGRPWAFAPRIKTVGF